MLVHTIRDLRTGKLKDVELTRSKAIKYFCLECCGGDRKAIRECTATHCPLYPFRPFQASRPLKNHSKKEGFLGVFEGSEAIFEGH